MSLMPSPRATRFMSALHTRTINLMTSVEVCFNFITFVVMCFVVVHDLERNGCQDGNRER